VVSINILLQVLHLDIKVLETVRFVFKNIVVHSREHRNKIGHLLKLFDFIVAARLSLNCHCDVVYTRLGAQLISETISLKNSLIISQK
jgi:hypothetical protein